MLIEELQTPNFGEIERINELLAECDNFSDDVPMDVIEVLEEEFQPINLFDVL